ncbi:hypothetical protein HOLleu_06576 [Holothuria leucospilota]|uniref:Uncharacterized protein n=1 Tax=Holothuria leucospilota TaxID=206669 RepID=A0A9Q1CLK2_HOLLE|nr:hypothetical protein HOLleu_06576 [Holothuria leucospilota]
MVDFKPSGWSEDVRKAGELNGTVLDFNEMQHENDSIDCEKTTQQAPLLSEKQIVEHGYKHVRFLHSILVRNS